MTTPSGFDARGAVDLAALAQAREAQQRAEAQAQAARDEAARRAEQAQAQPAEAADGAVGAAGAAGAESAAGGAPLAPAAAAEGVYPGAYVVAVDEATFQTEILDRSHLVPVLVDFWADWCGPCKQLSPVLEKLVADDGGRWVLATIDVDANQALAQAFQVQSIPTVFAVVQGQPIPLFQGAQPEPQIRQVLDQLLQLAEQNGVTGRVDGVPTAPGTAGSGVAAPGAAPAGAATPHEPELDEAADAVERGDLAGAADAYRRLLARKPADTDARAGLALVTLLERTRGVDAEAALDAAATDPTDVGAACTAADVMVLNRRADAAFALLVETVRRTSGDDRDAARSHLVGLFDVLGDDDPAVGPARRALAAALF